MTRLHRLGTWILRLQVPTLEAMNRVPSLRWAWTGRFEHARKIAPDIIDGVREGLGEDRGEQ